MSLNSTAAGLTCAGVMLVTFGKQAADWSFNVCCCCDLIGCCVDEQIFLVVGWGWVPLFVIGNRDDACVSGCLFWKSDNGAVGRAGADGYCSFECTQQRRDRCYHGNVVRVCQRPGGSVSVWVINVGVKRQIIYLCIRWRTDWSLFIFYKSINSNVYKTWNWTKLDSVWFLF